MALTLAQQYTLDECLRRQNLLTNEDLILELTDHFMLSLDQQMADGVAFKTALASVVAGFGGRAELQRMERRYNSVTFGHYTDVWKQAALSQFRMPKLWFIIALFGCIIYLNMRSSATHNAGSYLSGMATGIIGGLLLGVVFNGGSQYVVALVKRGFHNPPTEIQYIITRCLTGALLLVGIGAGGFQFGQNWPFLLHPVLAAAYITGLYVFFVSYSVLLRHLYDLEPPTWNW